MRERRRYYVGYHEYDGDHPAVRERLKQEQVLNRHCRITPRVREAAPQNFGVVVDGITPRCGKTTLSVLPISSSEGSPACAWEKT